MNTSGLSNLVLKIFKIDKNEIVEIGDRVNKTVIYSSKNSTHMPNIEVIRKPTLVIPNIKKAFNYLQLAFIKALIF